MDKIELAFKLAYEKTFVKDGHNFDNPFHRDEFKRRVKLTYSLIRQIEDEIEFK